MNRYAKKDEYQPSWPGHSDVRDSHISVSGNRDGLCTGGNAAGG